MLVGGELKGSGTNGRREMVKGREWDRWDKGNGELKGSGTEGTKETVNCEGEGQMGQGKC